MDWKQKILEDDGFVDVYWKARKVASARSNFLTALAVFLLSASYLVINICSDQSLAPYSSLVSTVRTIGDIGFRFTTSILGFLIAGFAVFASITKPELFILLAQIKHKKGNINRLQFIFFNFLFVFFHYILFLAMCISVNIGLIEDGLFTELSRQLAEVNKQFFVYFLSIGLSFFLAWFVFLLMLLKSFIWNIYQAVLLSIVTEAELIEQRKDEEVRR